MVTVERIHPVRDLIAFFMFALLLFVDVVVVVVCLQQPVDTKEKKQRLIPASVAHNMFTARISHSCGSNALHVYQSNALHVYEKSAIGLPNYLRAPPFWSPLASAVCFGPVVSLVRLSVRRRRRRRRRP